MSEAIAVLTFDAFCAAEDGSDRRHEFVGGRVYAMAGGSERHDLAAGLFYERVAQGARAAGCRPFTSNRLVKVASGNGYYPDVMVVCGSAANRHYETNPSLVVEVLSRSTENIDRREKALAFCAGPDLRHYVLVHPDEQRFEVAHATDLGIAWTALGPGDVLDTGYGDVNLEAFYDALDAAATT